MNIIQEFRQEWGKIKILTPLCLLKKIKKCKAVDKYIKSIMNANDQYGMSLAHWAVAYGQKDFLEYLLSKCTTNEQKLALLNAKTKCGMSLAHCAAAYGQKELLDHLLDKWMNKN